MAKDDDQSLGDQQTYAGGAQPVDSSARSLGDQSTFGGAESSISDIGGPEGNADLDMEIVDLSRYTVQKTLGKGGMGEVLLAIDTRLNRKVAIKRMLGDAVKSQTAVRRFLTEARSTAKLSSHPNIVDIYDFGRDQDGPFLIMEYIDSGSLLDRCQDGPLSLEEAVDLTCQLCGALETAHQAGIILRDIKPANVLLTKDGIPALTDFGLAKDEVGDTGHTMAGAVLGTLDFMPPEQRRDAAEVDARSDLWSLAATFYQMVTGKSPRIIRFNNVPQAVQDVLGKALEDEKDDRYQTATEFRDALQGCLTAAEPAPEVAVDLGTGECPQCHAKNEAHRKFCRGCGESLRVSCLSCSGDMPVWENFCAECGGNQSELTSTRRAELDVQREQAESLREEHAFDKSLDIAREIAAVKDSRLQHQKEWSETFTTETETEKARQEQAAQDHFAESQTHRGACDYPAAIRALETIPEPLRTSEMTAYLQQVQSDQEESEGLIKTISERIKKRDLHGLLEQVERAVELRGDRADLQKLQSQLIERREKWTGQRDGAYLEAASLLAQGQAKEALARIQTVKTSELRSSDFELKNQLEEIVTAENELMALVKESKADGVLDPEEVVAMLQATVAYLKLNPRHEKIAGMQEQLIERIRKSPGKYSTLQLPDEVVTELPRSLFEEDTLADDDILGDDEELDGKVTLTPKIAKQFLADEDSVDLWRYTTIDRKAAQVLTKHNGALYLDHLTSLSVEVAEALAKHNDSLSLDGLTSVSVGVAEALAKFDDYLFLGGLTSLSVEAAEALAKHNDSVDLSGLTSVSVDVAEALAKHNGSLDLGGLTSVSVEVAEALAKHNSSLDLGGLTSVSVEVAEALAKHNDSLDLDGLTSLSVDVAQALAKHNGSLSINGLASVSVEVAEALAKLDGSLSFHKLTSLSVEAAEALAKHSGFLFLTALTSLSAELAQALAKHNGALSLTSLTSISVEVAEALARHNDFLFLKGLTSLSVEAAEALAKHQGNLQCKLEELPSAVATILRDAGHE